MGYRIVQARRNVSNFLTLRAKAAPGGVSIMHRSNNDMTERVETTSYINAVSRLDAGDYGDKPDEDMFVHLAIASGGNRGYFGYTSQHHAIIWRWLIMTALINEVRKKNNTVDIIDDSGSHSVVSVCSSGIVTVLLYPVAEYLAMANNIGGAMIEKYGVDVGTKNAIIFYSNMFDVEQRALTSFGREVLVDPHNSFIAELNKDSIPETPVAH